MNPLASADRDQPTARQHSAGYVWYAILLLAVVNVVNYMDRMALSVLMPSIKADLGLTDGQVGLLFGLAFSLLYAICGIPIARWADRGVRRNIVAISLAAWSVMTAVTGAAQNFWHLFLARVGVGVGEAGCVPPSESIICDYVPLRRRPGAFAIYQFGVFAGMMVGMGLSGWLAESIGWRWTLVALGLPGVALALVLRLTLREPERGSFDAVKQDDLADSSFSSTILVLWRCRTYRLITFFCAVNGFVQFGLNQWWPSFYARTHGLSLSSVGIQLGVAIGVGSGIGLLIGGLLANRAAQRDVRLPLLIGAASTVFALPTALASLFVSSATTSILLVALTALFWTVSNGPAAAALYSVTMSWMRATAGAVAGFATSLIGFGLGPFCVGLLSDVLTPSLGAESLRYALLAPICLLPGMVIALYAAAMHLPADLRAAGAT